MYVCMHRVSLYLYFASTPGHIVTVVIPSFTSLPLSETIHPLLFHSPAMLQVTPLLLLENIQIQQVQTMENIENINRVYIQMQIIKIDDFLSIDSNSFFLFE